MANPGRTDPRHHPDRLLPLAPAPATRSSNPRPPDRPDTGLPRSFRGRASNPGRYVRAMAVAQTVRRVRVGSGAWAERLVRHPRLPLVAGLDSERPAVHVWACGAGELRELGTVGGGSPAYAGAYGRERMKRTPAVAWHPDQALLLVASEGAVTRWTPAGVRGQGGLPPAAAYRRLAFSPDGRTLWASPSSRAANDPGSLACGAAQCQGLAARSAQ
jgi:hypothetical protein